MGQTLGWGSCAIRDANVLVIGLDGSGKSNLILRMLAPDGPTAAIVPVRAETLIIEREGVRLHVLELAGTAVARALWSHYYGWLDAVVFVVDSADRGRLDEAASELAKVADAPELAECVILVVANKSDEQDALGEAVLTDRLGVRALHQQHIALFSTSARTGAGVRAAEDWLSDTLLMPASEPEEAAQRPQ
jgi:small GTP-binding protein